MRSLASEMDLRSEIKVTNLSIGVESRCRSEYGACGAVSRAQRGVRGVLRALKFRLREGNFPGARVRVRDGVC